VQASDLAALPLIEKWISFASVSRDSNLPIIDWTQNYLEALGIECSRTYDDSGLKANLWATLPADNGETKIGGLVLSGHTDVVPVDGQPWDTNPFVAQVIGDRLYGRGVTDMKSYGATALMMVPELLQRKLKRPLHLAKHYETDMSESLKMMALEGHGVAFLPESSVVREVRNRQLARTDGPTGEWEVEMEIRLYRERPTPQRTGKALVARLWEYLVDLDTQRQGKLERDERQKVAAGKSARAAEKRES
jgi:acetylornithine deacetylase/succinyl-diaminopimelate desuccinylase-like protein